LSSKQHDFGEDAKLCVLVVIGVREDDTRNERSSSCTSETPSLFVSPLPGPPRIDSALLGQPYAILDSEQPHMYAFRR
jgi:hypothetical protein